MCIQIINISFLYYYIKFIQWKFNNTDNYIITEIKATTNGINIIKHMSLRVSASFSLTVPVPLWSTQHRTIVLFILGITLSYSSSFASFYFCQAFFIEQICSFIGHFNPFNIN